jgi:hypothetical protein
MAPRKKKPIPAEVTTATTLVKVESTFVDEKQVMVVDAFVRQQVKSRGPEWEYKFLEYAQTPGLSSTDLYTYLRQYGFVGSFSNCQQWMKHKFPTGAIAKEYNTYAEELRGLQVEGVLSMGLVQAMKWIQQIELHTNFEELANISVSQKLNAVPTMLKEIRAFAEAIQSIKAEADLIDAEKAGAYRLAQEVALTFKDTAMEQAVTEALKGALVKIESEII